MKNEIPEVAESDFKSRVLESPQPVIVEFGAEWCRPCKALEPVLMKLALEWEGKATLLQLDVDRAEQIIQTYSIFSVPTIMLFIKGQPVERLSGLQTEPRLRDKLGSHLG